MIRLNENKYLEDYFIDINGVITDKYGNIQHPRIHHGWLVFKGQCVHKIQMYTNYEFRSSKEYVIHHLDKNKLNNSLKNLVYLTPNEHNALHSYREVNPMLGKHHTEEAKRKMKGKNIWTKNSIWVNNRIICKRVAPDKIPEGFKRGRL